MADVARLAVLFIVVIDPFAAAIGAATLTGARDDRSRRALALGGAVVALALLEVVIGIADPLLDALHISDPAAELAAGMVVLVPALDLSTIPVPTPTTVILGLDPRTQGRLCRLRGGSLSV